MRVAIVLALMMLIGCEINGREPPSRSERERDSILGQSELPGAAGVRGALEAGDSSASRSAQYDSMAGN